MLGQAIVVLCALGCKYVMSYRSSTAYSNKVAIFRLYGGGFGASPVSPTSFQLPTDDSLCACGSLLQYHQCCKSAHSDLNAEIDPATLIKARYSAYASGNIDFIIQSTSKSSPDYAAYMETATSPKNGLKRWQKDIKSNMIEGFFYVKLQVLSTEIDEGGQAAHVLFRHLAIRKADNVMFPIEEKSLLHFEDGKWRYSKGVVSRPEPQDAQVMMTEWPQLMGLELKPMEDAAQDGGKTRAVMRKDGGGSGSSYLKSSYAAGGLKPVQPIAGTSNRGASRKKV